MPAIDRDMPATLRDRAGAQIKAQASARYRGGGVSESISVVIVDDHQMFREGIRSRIEGESDMTVVGEAGTAEAAFDLVEETDPRCRFSTSGCPTCLDWRRHDCSGTDIRI